METVISVLGIVALILSIGTVSCGMGNEQKNQEIVSVEETIEEIENYIAGFDSRSTRGYYEVSTYNFSQTENRIDNTIIKCKNKNLDEKYINKLESLKHEIENRKAILATLEKEYMDEASKPVEFVTSYKEIGMPKAMAESLLYMRHGVDDFSGNTVSDIFLTKSFTPVKQLDGTYASVKFKKSVAIGNTYNLIVESIYGENLEKSYKVETTIKFTLIYEDGTTFYDRVQVNNHKTGETLDSYDFNDKAAILMMVFSK